MRRTTAVSIVALGSFIVPAHAQQTGTFDGSIFVPQGQVFQGQPQFDNQTIFYDPNTGLPVPPPQAFGQQPQPPQNFEQPQPQFPPQPPQNFGQQPQFVPQPQQPSFGEQPFQPQPQPPFGQQQPQFGEQQPQFQPQPDPNAISIAPPQPQQPIFAPEQPRQPSNGTNLPQPREGYNPPQPSTAPQISEQPSGDNVPYYDRPRPVRPAPPVETPTQPLASQPETPPQQGGAPLTRGEPLPQPLVVGPPPPPSFAASASGADRGPTMAAELDELLAVGERYRAASPGFLEDLKALASKYRDPLPEAPVAAGPAVTDTDDPLTASADPTVTLDPGQGELTADPSADTGSFTPTDPGVGAITNVAPIDPGSTSFAYLEDYFTDGEIQNNPPWRIRQGDWAIDPTYGLRAKAPEQVSDAPIRPKELLKALLTGDSSEVDASAPQSKAALIESQTSIGNAFSLGARIVDHEGKGTAHFIMHQGGANWLGYRLEVRSGPQPVIVLTRRGSNGYKDITKVSVPAFTTGKEHELRWARLSDGQMIILLDKRPIITSRDTVFREDWKGFAFFNAGGDVSIRALRISAPVER